MPKKVRVVSICCVECGNGLRNHRILYEHIKSVVEESRHVHDEFHQLIQCMGCETFRYRRFSLEYEEAGPFNESVYPDGNLHLSRHSFPWKASEIELLPEIVWKMYRETIFCVNAGVRMLTGAGLRATVEAICVNLGFAEGNLQQKIDKLAGKNLLTTSQAELLHEERYLGNASLHELATPTVQNLEDGLGIVEGLITTIYILPSKAKRLKEQRTSKVKAKDA